MINQKEAKAAVIMAVVFLLLPDVGLNKAQCICLLIALFGTAWTALTKIEIVLENRIAKRRKQRRAARRERTDEYVLYETYKDGTVHRVPMPAGR